MDDQDNRSLSKQPVRAQALANVRQFENGLLASTTPEKPLKPLITACPTERLDDILFSPDGTLIAASLDRLILLWDRQSGKCIQVLAGHTSGVKSLVMTPDGERMLSSSWDEVIMWDLKTGQPLWTQKKKYPGCFVMTPDGQFVVEGNYRWITLWDLDYKKRLDSFGARINDFVNPLAVSPDGRLIAIGSTWRRDISVCDREKGHHWEDLSGHIKPVRTLAFTPDGRSLISGGEDWTLCLWDMASSRCLQVMPGHNGTVRALAVTPDGTRVISGGDDKTVRVWDLQSQRCLQVLLGHRKAVHSVAVSPDGKWIASGGNDSVLHLWDLETGQLLQELGGLTRTVHSVTAFTDSQLTISTDKDEKALWLNKFTREGHSQHGRVSIRAQRRIYAVAVSPDGEQIATGGYRAVFIYATRSGQLLQQLKGYQDYVRALAFSPDGNSLVTGAASLDGCLRAWDLRTGRELWVTNSKDESQIGINSIAFHPDGKTLLVGGVSDISLWDMAAGKCIRFVVKRHDPHFIGALAFHPDGTRFATGVWDEKVRLWDLETGDCLRTFEGHTRYITALAFSPDGNLLLSGAKDGLLNFWDVTSGELLGTTYNLMEGYLWTTPPDDFAPNGWLHTDCPGLITLLAQDEESGAVDAIPDDNERFSTYMRLYHDPEMVMKRIYDQARYKQLLRLRQGNKAAMDGRLLEKGEKEPSLLPEPKPDHTGDPTHEQGGN